MKKTSKDESFQFDTNIVIGQRDYRYETARVLMRKSVIRPEVILRPIFVREMTLAIYTAYSHLMYRAGMNWPLFKVAKTKMGYLLDMCYQMRITLCGCVFV